MTMMRMLAVVVVLVAMTACTGWRVESVAPQQLIADKQPSRIRVQLDTGAALVIANPSTVADTLVGVDVTGERSAWAWGALLASEGRLSPVRVPLSHVHQIATRRVSATKTALFIGSEFAAGLALVAILSGGCVGMSC